jgi:competence protein ComEC
VRPRPIVLLVLCFEAGLATGLARFPAPTLVIVVLAAAGWLLHRRALAWLPAAAAIGFLHGAVARAGAREWCAARLAEGELRLPVRLIEPVQDGVAAARPDRGFCRGTITVRVRGERLLPAGTRWLLTGRWIPALRWGGRPDGIFVARELAGLASAPSPSEQLRTWIAGTTRRLYGTRAGLVEALLVGRRGGIDPALNAAFARSGLVHLLSISGFHVGVFFGWTILLLRRLGARRGAAAGWGAAAVFLYVGFLGWPAPAARAALLCGLGAWSAGRQRHPAAVPLLAVTCLGVTLLDPWAIFDLGGWLSAGAFWGALTFTRWSDRALGEHAGWRMLFASLGATLTTAPLTAAAFGSVALVGVALNFLAIPLAAIAVPAVLASVAVAAADPRVAAWLAGGGGLGLAGLEALARGGSAVPVGTVLTTPGPEAALPWVAVLLGVLWALGRRNTSRRAALKAGWLVGLAGLVTALPLGGVLSADPGTGLALHFLSVGQGDATLIRTPAGRWLLVDAGPADGRRDAGRAVILPFLVRQGVRKLALFVLTHAHLDHLGGAEAVLREVPPDLIVEPAEPVAEPHYLRLLDLIAERGFSWRPARAGDSLVVDGVRLLVLHPDTTWARWREDLNDDSVVLLLRYREFEAVLAGDLGERAESLVAGRAGRVDLLKVGHHGSATSSGVAWLRELGPRAAIVSVGPNRYGHPAPGALARLLAAGAEVWRTDREGTVSVTVQETTMTVRGRRGARTYSLRPER